MCHVGLADPGERATSGIYEMEDAKRAEVKVAGLSGGSGPFGAQGLKG